MHPFSGRCPICGQGMVVTRLHCRTCDSALEGNFALSRFASLTPEQASFLETFVRCQGKLSWVGEELALSYPTVRSRLKRPDPGSRVRGFGRTAGRGAPALGPAAAVGFGRPGSGQDYAGSGGHPAPGLNTSLESETTSYERTF